MKPKNKKHTKEEKIIKELKSKDIRGEESPYRNWLEKKGDYNQKHGAEEPSEANPDVLPEAAGLYYTPDNDRYEVEVIKAMWDSFTPLEQDVLQMVGYEGRSLYNCALKLGISKGSVQKIIERSRKKIKRCLTNKRFSGI